MIVLKTNISEFNNRTKIWCPYCKTDQWGPKSAFVYKHNCPDAGTCFFLNGHMFVAVPNYLEEEQASAKQH